MTIPSIKKVNSLDYHKEIEKSSVENEVKESAEIDLNDNRLISNKEYDSGTLDKTLLDAEGINTRHVFL